MSVLRWQHTSSGDLTKQGWSQFLIFDQKKVFSKKVFFFLWPTNKEKTIWELPLWISVVSSASGHFRFGQFSQRHHFLLVVSNLPHDTNKPNCDRMGLCYEQDTRNLKRNYTWWVQCRARYLFHPVGQYQVLFRSTMVNIFSEPFSVFTFWNDLSLQHTKGFNFASPSKTACSLRLWTVKRKEQRCV